MKKYGVFGAIPDGACSNTLHNNFHFSWNSVCRTKQSYRALFGDIRWSGEPIRSHRWHYKIALFSEATFIFKFEFTAWVVCSSTDAPFIPLQLSWQLNPFYSLRVAHVASRRVALVVRTESLFVVSFSSCRVLFEVRTKYMTFRAGIGQTPNASFTLQAEPSRTEPKRTESDRLSTAQFYG